MTRTVFKLEWAPTVSPRSFPASGDWVDLSPRMEPGAQISGGRSNRFERFEPRRLTAVLNNKDRAITPGDASSPYYPNVVQDTWVRMSAIRGANTYRRFTGLVTRWKPVWGFRDRIELEAVDGSKVFSSKKLTGSAQDLEILSDAPRAYYKLDETTLTAPVVDSSGNALNGRYVGNPTLSQVDPVTDSINGAVLFDGVDDYIELPTGASFNHADMTIMCWVKVSTVGDYGLVAQEPDSELSGGVWFLELNAGRPRVFTGNNSAGAEAMSPTSIADGSWHHVAGVIDSVVGAAYIYVDGILKASQGPVPSGGASEIPKTVYIGCRQIAQGPLFQFLAGSLDAVAIFPMVLSAARIAAIYEARNGWANQLSGTRITKLADKAGWPATLRDIDAGQSMLQGRDNFNGSVLDAMTDVARSEHGVLYFRGDGTLVFRERHAILKAPYTTPVATFANFPQAGEYYYKVPEPEFDDHLLTNEVRYQREGGPEQVAVDASSRFLDRTTSENGLQNASDLEVNDLMHFRLFLFKQPFLTFRNLPVIPTVEGDDTLWSILLALEFEDRVRMIRRASGGASLADKQGHIQHITETIRGAGKWSFDYILSAAYAQNSGWWQLGVSGASELGITTRLVA